MTTMYRLLIGFVIAALWPDVAAAQKVRYDFVPTTDFSRFKTYALSETSSPDMETMTEKTTLYDSPFIKHRTNQAIEAQLQARGLTRDDKNPDMIVSARRSFKTEYVTYGYYPVWGWGDPYQWGYYGGGYHHGGAVFTEEITVGTLTIDFKDATNGQLFWRGSGEKTVKDTSKPEKRIKRVNREVAKIFRNFPPHGTMAEDDDDDDDDDKDDD